MLVQCTILPFLVVVYLSLVLFASVYVHSLSSSRSCADSTDSLDSPSPLSLSAIAVRFSRWHLMSAQSYTLVCPLVGVFPRVLSLFFLCLAYYVEIGGKWSYSLFCEVMLLGFFKRELSILVYSSSSFSPVASFKNTDTHFFPRC